MNIINFSFGSATADVILLLLLFLLGRPSVKSLKSSIISDWISMKCRLACKTHHASTDEARFFMWHRNVNTYTHIYSTIHKVSTVQSTRSLQLTVALGQHSRSQFTVHCGSRILLRHGRQVDRGSSKSVCQLLIR